MCTISIVYEYAKVIAYINNKWQSWKNQMKVNDEMNIVVKGTRLFLWRTQVLSAFVGYRTQETSFMELSCLVINIKTFAKSLTYLILFTVLIYILKKEEKKKMLFF